MEKTNHSKEKIVRYPKVIRDPIDGIIYFIREDVYNYLLQEDSNANLDDLTFISRLYSDSSIRVEADSPDKDNQNRCGVMIASLRDEKSLESLDYPAIVAHYAQGIHRESKTHLPSQPRVLLEIPEESKNIDDYLE